MLLTRPCLGEGDRDRCNQEAVNKQANNVQESHSEKLRVSKRTGSALSSFGAKKRMLASALSCPLVVHTVPGSEDKCSARF